MSALTSLKALFSLSWLTAQPIVVAIAVCYTGYGPGIWLETQEAKENIPFFQCKFDLFSAALRHCVDSMSDSLR